MAAYTDDYTSRRRTRIYRKDQNTQVMQAETIGQTQAIPPQKKLFDGMSIAQIIAGAAAAATSVALSSYIGIAGSIIGAAISSVVTVVSSQVYRRFLDASAQRIKTAGAMAHSNMKGERAAHAAVGRGARIAPESIRERAAAARASTQRKVVLFSVLAAACAVVVCAVAIWVGTAGEGIGEKTEPIIAIAPTVTQSGQDPSSMQTTEPEPNVSETTQEDGAAEGTGSQNTDDATATEPVSPDTTPADDDATDSTSPDASSPTDQDASAGQSQSGTSDGTTSGTPAGNGTSSSETTGGSSDANETPSAAVSSR